MEINYLILLLNIAVALVGYMLIPVILRITNGAYEFKEANRISLLNSIFVCLFFYSYKSS